MNPTNPAKYNIFLCLTRAGPVKLTLPGDYEQMMQDSASKRADDSKGLANKEGALADMKAQLENDTDGLTSTNKELGATVQYISSLHSECDWLLRCNS